MKITETQQERDLRATKCKTCGMSLLVQNKKYTRVAGKKQNIVEYMPKTYCDSVCEAAYKKYPGQLGLWWS